MKVIFYRLFKPTLLKKSYNIYKYNIEINAKNYIDRQNPDYKNALGELFENIKI